MEHAWRKPLVVLDASAHLPIGDESPPAVPSRLCARLSASVDELSAGLAATDRVASILRDLGRLALNQAAAWPSCPPSADESATASAGGSHGLRPDEQAERLRYDEFFGIRRQLPLSVEALASTTLLSVGETLLDVADSQLGLHEILAILKGLVLITQWIEDRPSEFRPDGLIGPQTRRGLYRFRLGHIIFALMCNLAAHHLARASDSLTTSREPRSEDLTFAAVAIRASTASMWYAASVPQRVYLSEIRPPMDAASTKTHGFSGLDNFDFRKLREAWEGLVSPLEMAIEQSQDAGLRARAHTLYEIIVEDIEHHTLIAAQLVGTAPSLKLERMKAMSVSLAMPAVSSLRDSGDERKQLLSRVSGE